MLGNARLRSIVRQFVPRSLLLPAVNWIEGRRLATLGTYTATQAGPGELTISGCGRDVTLSGLPENLCAIGLSDHERSTILAMLSRVKAGTVAWDVGANVGFYSRLLAALVGPDGQVAAFEPDRDTFRELQHNLIQAPRVTAHCLGLSDNEGTASFATSADYSPVGRIVHGESIAGGDVSTIEVARGDVLVSERGLPQPSFLKVDVEGHELSTLRGMEAVLANPRCQSVLVEVHFKLLNDAGQSDTPDRIVALLRNCGLTQQHWIARSHLLADRAARA